MINPVRFQYRKRIVYCGGYHDNLWHILSQPNPLERNETGKTIECKFQNQRIYLELQRNASSETQSLLPKDYIYVYLLGESQREVNYQARRIERASAGYFYQKAQEFLKRNPGPN